MAAHPSLQKVSGKGNAVSTEIRYCSNMCKRRNGDESYPATTEGKSNLCNQCEDRLKDWLGRIPDNYALLPFFVEHGTTESNPESKATKSANAPAPMRLDAIDLLDTRRGRKWLGTEVTTDRRGTIGVLQAWVELVCDERPVKHPASISVVSACELLTRHRLWVAEQEWVPDFYDEIRKLHRTIADAIGDYRPKPVGRCTHTPEDAETACGGPLYPRETGGVSCAKCHEHTKEEHLRILGAALTQQAG